MESKTTHIDMKKAKVEMLISSSESFRRYHESGDNTRLSKLVSMMYLLNTCTNELRMEADEILDRYEIRRGKIKTLSNNVEQSFDAYNNYLAAMLGDNDEAKRRFSGHYDGVMADIRVFMDLDGKRNNQNTDNQ